MTKYFEWIDTDIEVPADPETAVLVICSGTSGRVRFEDAYELAWYDHAEEEWILEAYPGSCDIVVKWWAFLPEPPEEGKTNAENHAPDRRASDLRGAVPDAGSV